MEWFERIFFLVSVPSVQTLKTNERPKSLRGHNLHTIIFARHEHNRYMIDSRREDRTIHQ